MISGVKVNCYIFCIISPPPQIFSVDVYGADDCLLNREQLYEQLKHVVKHSSKPGPELGVMTTEHRDQWSKTYKEMTQG